jgi:BolA protein
VQRHRMINEILAPEFAGGMHALAIHVYTTDEWRSRFQQAPMSPPCAGGESAQGERGGVEQV